MFAFKLACLKAKFHCAIQLATSSRPCRSNRTCRDSSNLSETCFRLNSITLSRSQIWSQTWLGWFPTCRRQVRASGHVGIERTWSQTGSQLDLDQLSTGLRHAHAGLWPGSGQIPLRYPAREPDSVMEFGLKHTSVKFRSAFETNLLSWLWRVDLVTIGWMHCASAACQELLMKPDVVHHGYLRRRHVVNKVLDTLKKSSMLPMCNYLPTSLL